MSYGTEASIVVTLAVATCINTLSVMATCLVVILLTWRHRHEAPTLAG